MLDLTDYSDLPLLVDPLVDEVPASPDDDIAKELLATLTQTTETPANETPANEVHTTSTEPAIIDISSSKGIHDGRPWRVRAFVAAAAALVLFVGVLALPNGAGTTPAEALQQGADLLGASESGRGAWIKTEVVGDQRATISGTYEWNGNSGHTTAQFDGSIAEEDAANGYGRGSSGELYYIGSELRVSIDGGPYGAGQRSGTSPEVEALERFEELLAVVDVFDGCGADDLTSSLIGGRDVESYCGSGSGIDFYHRVAFRPGNIPVGAGNVSVRIDIDRSTGIVAALTVEVVDLVVELWMPPGAPEAEPVFLQYDSVIEQAAWHDLGAAIDIVLPPLG